MRREKCECGKTKRTHVGDPLYVDTDPEHGVDVHVGGRHINMGWCEARIVVAAIQEADPKR